MKSISLLSFLFLVILPDESGIGDLNFVNGFLSLVILNWIEDLNFENSVQKRDSRFRENDKVEEREKGDSRFRGNDKRDGNDKEDGSDKTFFVILNWIEDLYYANCMQKRDSRFHGNDKGGGNDKTFLVILNWIGDLNRVNGFLFLVILPDKSGIGDLYRVNTKFVKTLETNV